MTRKDAFPIHDVGTFRDGDLWDVVDGRREPVYCKCH